MSSYQHPSSRINIIPPFCGKQEDSNSPSSGVISFSSDILPLSMDRIDAFLIQLY